jgi:cytoskeletal protein RodZ
MTHDQEKVFKVDKKAQKTGAKTTVNPSKQTPGSYLKSTRETLGLSLKAVSASTRIGVDQLNALEGDQFNSLSSRAYIKGFLRNYANELNLDSDEVISLYNLHAGETPSTRKIISGFNSNSTALKALSKERNKPWFAYAISAAIIILGLACSIIVFGDANTEPLSDNSASSTTESWDPTR